jgi:hypothetical protein
VYVPVETYLSLPNLLSPFYIVDLVGMLLLAAGLWRYWRNFHAAYAPILVAGFSWTGANFWRGMVDRLRMAELQQAGWTPSDSLRITVVGGVLILLAVCGMVLALRASGGRQTVASARISE